MFHLMPVRLWRRISMALALLSVGAALVGSLLLDGPLTIRWGGRGLLPAQRTCGRLRAWRPPVP